MDLINALKNHESYERFKATIDPILDSYEENYFDDVLLSQDYEKVILKGTQFPASLKVLFETHLIKTRLFEKDEKHKHDSSKGQIDFLMFLIGELNKHKESSDGVFVFISRYIASSIHILKNQLKHTYDEIPWEEMEFCLVIFIASKIGRDLTMISHLLLDRKTILCYLNDFCAALSNHNAKSNKSKTKPINRAAIKSSVLSIHPHFNKLYEDYETLRDIYSLRRIQSYMNVALTSEESQMQPHALERTLQVIGENLKNTRDSPNISLEAKDRVLNPAPKYLKENLTSLRDVLSHLNFINGSTIPNIFHLPDARRNKILRNVLMALRNIFYKNDGHDGIINDLKEMYVNIVAVLYEKLIHVCIGKERNALLMDDDLNLLFKEECEKLDEIVKESNFKALISTSIFNEFYKMNFEQVKAVYMLCSELEGFNYKSNFNAIVNNVSSWIFETCTTIQNFNKSSIEQTIAAKDGCDVFSFPVKEIRSIADYRKELEGDNGEENAKQKVDIVFSRMHDVLKDVKEKERFYKKVEALKAVHSAKAKILKSEMLCKNEYQESIKKFPSRIAKPLEKLCPQNDLDAIKNTVKRVYDAYGVLVNDVATEGVICIKNYRNLLSQVCNTLNLKNHSSVIDHLVKGFKKEMEKYSEDTLSQLTEIIMNINGMNNNDLRIISIEMLLLDLLEVLMSTYNFTDNATFLDRFAPLLIGKNLRNYLAHGNPLIDTFPFEPRNSIEIHCTFFKEKLFIFDEKVSYGQITNFTLESAKEVYCKRLDIMKNQIGMFEAARQGNMRKVEECIRNGADPSACDVKGETGLKCAVKANNVELLLYFLKQNVDDGVESLLEIAAENGCESIVEYLLKNNQQAMEYMRGNNKLLHLAVLNDKRNLVKLLLNSGCEPNVVVCGRTPLYIAALKHFNVTADILINHGASISLKDNFGEQPFHAAAKSGNWKCAEMLLNKGVDIEAKNYVGYTSLELAAMFGRAEFIDKLLQRSVEDNRLRNKFRNNALFLAVSHGHEKCVEVLLKHKAQPETKTEQLQTPLHVAAYFGYRNIVKQLLRSGASTEDNDRNFCTALHFAAFRGWTDLIKPLFKRGFKTEKLETPLHFATYCGNKETVEAVLECEYEVIDCVDVDGCTALHMAAFHGYADTVKMLIKAKAKINILSKRRNTAFLAAILAGHFDVINNFLQLCKIPQHELNCGLYSAITYKHDVCLVEMLLNGGADPNFQVQLKSNPVELPMKFLTCESLKKIEKGVGICDTDHLLNLEPVIISRPLPVISSNCLIAAIQAGDVNTVKLLLKKGVDDNAPLIYQELVLVGTEEIPYTFQNFLDTRILLSRKPSSLETTDVSYGYHCLHIASVYGHTEIIELLLKHESVDKDIKDSNGSTPLWHAATNDQQNAVKLLLKAGADPNVPDLLGHTPLYRAVYLGFVQTACILLYHDATNIHIKSECCDTILDKAVESGQTVILEMLLNYHFTFDERYKAVQTAIRDGKVEAFKILLNTAHHGEDFFVALRNSNEPLLRTAIFWEEKEIVEILLNHCVDVNAKFGSEEDTILHVAVSHNNKADIVELLLEQHADVNMVTAFGETPLNLAIQQHNVEIARSLLKYGADATKPASTNDGRTNVTPLHYAAKTSNCSAMLTLLLDNIKEKHNDVLPYINAKDSNGDTPLIWKFDRYFLENAKLLITAGADVNLQNNEGMSALHCAVRTEETVTAELLIKNGADLNLQNKEGMSALHYAMSNGDTELTQLLIANGADVTLKNKDGQTAAEMPCEKCDELLSDDDDYNSEDTESNDN